MSDLEKLAVDHNYYCNEGNYYSNEPSETFETMTNFLDEYDGADIDMNFMFRWDIKLIDEDNESDGYCADVFLMLQRKGIFKPISIEHISEDEAKRFEQYARKHWENMQQIWEPLSNV